MTFFHLMSLNMNNAVDIIKIFYSRFELSNTSPCKINTYNNILKSLKYYLNTFLN